MNNMKKESNVTIFNLTKFLFFLPMFFVLASHANAQSFSLFNNTLKTANLSTCYLRAEENQFTKQVTYNEVCNPRFVDYDSKGSQNVLNNFYQPQFNQPQVAPYYQTSYSYVQPVNYGYPNTINNNSYYNNSAYGGGYSPNTWNGYGNASNYLLSSFGGGYGGDSGSSLLNNNFNYGSYGYPNSVGHYTPSIYDRYYGYERQGIPQYGDGSGYNYGNSEPYFDPYNYGDFNSARITESGTFNDNEYWTATDMYNNSATICPNCSPYELGLFSQTY
jgi:hypothetical protein